jgi:hypothetical protein
LQKQKTKEIQAKQKKVEINEAYILIGNLSEKMTTMTEKRLGLCLTAEKQKCINCAIGKGRQANLNKVSNHIMSNKIRERMFLDMSAVMPNNDSDSFVESSYKRYRRIQVMKHLNSVDWKSPIYFNLPDAILHEEFT